MRELVCICSTQFPLDVIKKNCAAGTGSGCLALYKHPAENSMQLILAKLPFPGKAGMRMNVSDYRQNAPTLRET